MEKIVLKDFETFNEFPDSYLEIKSDSEYYYIGKKTESFVAKRKVDLVSTVKIYSKEKVLEIESYYDVCNGNKALKTESISNLDGINKEYVKKDDGVKIIPLNSILEEESEIIYLSKKDVIKLIKNNSNDKSKKHTLIYKK